MGGNNSGITIINGNDGNDWLSPGNSTGDGDDGGIVTIKGGKGDDIINEVPAVYDANGVLTGFDLSLSRANGLAADDGTERFEGGPGND